MTSLKFFGFILHEEEVVPSANFGWVRKTFVDVVISSHDYIKRS